MRWWLDGLNTGLASSPRRSSKQACPQTSIRENPHQKQWLSMRAVGYSSRMACTSALPRPDPVPPVRLCRHAGEDTGVMVTAGAEELAPPAAEVQGLVRCSSPHRTCSTRMPGWVSQRSAWRRSMPSTSGPSAGPAPSAPRAQQPAEPPPMQRADAAARLNCQAARGAAWAATTAEGSVSTRMARAVGLLEWGCCKVG